MICSNCGRQLADDALFCPSCGANIPAPQSASTPQSTTQYQPANQAPAFDELRSSYENGTPYPRQNTYSQGSGTTFWIVGLKIIAWIIFGLIILSGLIMGVIASAESYNPAFFFLFLIGSFIIAFLCVATVMIFLDMAGDIRKIREKINRM